MSDGGTATTPTSSTRGRGAGAWLRPLRLSRRSDMDLPSSGPLAADAVLAAVLLVIPVVGYLQMARVSAGWWDAPRWLGLALIVPQFVPLAWRRTRPELTMGWVGWSTAIYFALGYAYSFNVIGVFVALYSVAAYARRRKEGIASAAVTMVVMAVVFIGQVDDLAAGLSGFAFNLFFFGSAWATGDANRSRRQLVAELHSRTEAAEQARALAAERAAADERTRIARELHDLVAHTVSVMVVQAGAGRRVAASDPAAAEEALRAVEATGREALDELRRVVGVLRDGKAHPALTPLPTLAELPDLVERIRATGVPIDLVVDDAVPALPIGIEVSLYRVVQEALTNVLKHAGPVRRVAARLAYADDRLVVTVTDDGRGAAAPDQGTGAGTVGMRERMALLGGDLTAGPRPDGGYEVRATLPVVGDQSRVGR